MPQARLVPARIQVAAGQAIPQSGWAERLFPTKAEFKEFHSPEEIVIEATADRLDLLCDSGLGMALGGSLGTYRGPIGLRAGPESRIGRIEVDDSVRPLRPEIGAVELTPPEGVTVDAGLLGEAVRFQELLHATLGLDRRLASFGLYSLERIRGPISYRSETADQVRFVPLDESASVTGGAFLASHPMAARYGGFGSTETGMLVLRDAAGAVLSVPPILNAEGPGSVRPGDGPLLLESTGTRRGRVADGIGLLMLPFVAAGWAVTPVPVSRAGEVETGATLVAGRSLLLTASGLTAIAGRAVPAREVESALASCRLAAVPTPEGWRVTAPPWRPDLLGEVDLIEEVLLAAGVRVEDGLMLPSATRGHRRPESDFRDRVAELLLASGFVPLHTPVLVGEGRAQRIGRVHALRLTNPVSEEVAVMRDRLLPSLVASLSRNVRHAYPQSLSEVGPVIVPDRTAESGGRTSWRAGFVRAGDGSGFADAAARIDAVLRRFGALGVREPAELPGLIPGRGAVLRVAGETVAELGELHPQILEAEKIPVPVSYGEIDLSALWPLVRRSATD
jgi:phenylalanyl-tRNA synthetase beta chain